VATILVRRKLLRLLRSSIACRALAFTSLDITGKALSLQVEQGGVSIVVTKKVTLFSKENVLFNAFLTVPLVKSCGIC
jgi:hypothetical protein